ncbi:MAG: hypothetical protein RIB03_07405 [Henriciella sp.]|uniref:hypothetical protein n=1 Tax=Henriciella sp. TaxID=1968823 RepID=UPI0026395A16|nr:hypothetical protein [Henriciella sp.]
MSENLRTNDVVAIASCRSALAFAMECLERGGHRHDELERLVESALQMATRKELECSVIRDLTRSRTSLGFVEG